MASTTRLLQYNFNVFRKISYIKLIREGGYILAGNHNTHCARCESALWFSYCLPNSSFPDKFPLISNSPARPATNVSNEEAHRSSLKHPNLSRYPKVPTEKILSSLTSYGFSIDDVAEMVAKCPEILSKTKQEFNETISSLRRCRFREEEILSILKSCPHHFSADPNAIVSRYVALRNQFSQKLVQQMFSTCPNIMFVKWKNIQEKIMYLKNVMFVVDRQIAFSSALECPLDLIKARHSFLERAGLFETPDPKSNVLSKNPSLPNIIDTDDEYFAENVAGLTVEEYFVFLEMFNSGSDVNQESEDESEDSD